MKKNIILSLFVLLLFSFSLVVAEGDSGRGNNECSLDSDCSDGRICLSGECEDNGSGSVDDSGDDSNNGSVDDDVPECVLDSDCSDGRICLSGECEDNGSGSVDDSNNGSVDNNSSISNETSSSDWKTCFDGSMARNMNQLMMKLRISEINKDDKKTEELKQEIAQLSLKIREKAAECVRIKNINLGSFVSDAVKFKNGGASEIVDYYKMKLSEISDSDNYTEQIIALKNLRDEIDNKIETLLKEKQVIRTEEMKDLVSRFEIGKDKIRADDVEVDAENRTITTEINGKQVEIHVAEGQITITVDGVKVNSEDIVLDNGTISVNGTVLVVLPAEILSRHKLLSKEMRLERKEERLVYKVQYDEKKKLFGIFKAIAHREAEIDGEDGNKLDDKGPWWDWLSTRDGSAESETGTTE